MSLNLNLSLALFSLSHTHPLSLSLPCAGFGFCEYGDPESTLRALRILHEFKLGDKNLVVKVDSKTRTDLLKYVMKKKRKADQETVDEAAVSLYLSRDLWDSSGCMQIDREVEGMDEKRGTVVLKEVTDEQQKVSSVHLLYRPLLSLFLHSLPPFFSPEPRKRTVRSSRQSRP